MDELINELMNQLQSDIENGDMEAIEELLKLVVNKQNRKYFIAFLSEHRINNLGYDLKDLMENADD